MGQPGRRRQRPSSARRDLLGCRKTQVREVIQRPPVWSILCSTPGTTTRSRPVAGRRPGPPPEQLARASGRSSAIDGRQTRQSRARVEPTAFLWSELWTTCVTRPGAATASPVDNSGVVRSVGFLPSPYILWFTWRPPQHGVSPPEVRTALWPDPASRPRPLGRSRLLPPASRQPLRPALRRDDNSSDPDCRCAGSPASRPRLVRGMARCP